MTCGVNPTTFPETVQIEDGLELCHAPPRSHQGEGRMVNPELSLSFPHVHLQASTQTAPGSLLGSDLIPKARGYQNPSSGQSSLSCAGILTKTNSASDTHATFVLRRCLDASVSISGI
jgi:hypothetical protein